MDELAIALQIAIKAHAGQKDKVGMDYIWHPVTVALYCRSARGKIAALLHDVVEDTPLALADLRAAGIGEDILAAVDRLTKRKGETVDEYYKRVAANDIATEVKFADMRHNSDVSRFPLDRQDEAAANALKYQQRTQKLRRLTGQAPEQDGSLA